MLRFWSTLAAATLASVAVAHAEQGPLPDTGSGITRDIGSIAVIEHDGSDYGRKLPDGTLNYPSRIAVAKRFYQTHGDFYDFLIIFTNFEFDTGDAAAFHSLVSNSVTGIGKPQSQGTAEFGSLGRLKGVVDMAALSRYHDANGPLSPRPGDPKFLVALNILAHEMGHQWLAQAQYRDAAGNVSNDLIGKDGSHWSYLLDSDASTMYGSDWVETAPGHFKAERVRAGYSPLDLYLMGFLSPGQVPPFSLLRAPGVDATALPVEGAELDATAETITISQVISAMGPRSPDYENSQKEFRLGFVFLTAPGIEPSAEDLEAVETIRQYFSAHFFALTRGIGLADTALTDSPAVSTVATPDLDLAKAWLLGRQQVDGRFEDSGSTTIRDTAAAAVALGSSGIEPLAAARALGWLDTVAPANADYKARQVASLAPSANASRRSLFRTELLSYASEFGGFGLFPGFAPDPIDTALVLQALRVSQAPIGPAIDSAFNALADSRFPGGGWSTVAAAGASVASTAEVLRAIKAWEEFDRGTGLKADALLGLLALQNADGGFGENGASTAYATAVALAALTEALAPTTVAQPAIAWLQNHQAGDGSWNESVYETARVLSALKDGTKPNLIVSPGPAPVEPPTPDEGDAVTVTVTVKNVGRTLATPTRAAFYDGDPKTNPPISVIDIPEIGPGSEFVAQFIFDTAGRPGRRSLYVVADTDTTLDEVNENDNTGSIDLTVKGLQADLEVRPEGIEVTPVPLVIGDVALIKVIVTNKGERVAPANILRVTDGDPRAGGVLIGQVEVQSLAPGEVAAAQLSWEVQGTVGPREIHATADAAFAIAELDERNNDGAVFVEIASAVPDEADLVMESARFEPGVLQRIPSVVRYHAVVANVGRAAADAMVRLFDAAAPTIALAEQTVPLAGRSRFGLTFDVPVAAPGNRVVIARVDPDDLLIEADETNNDVSALLTDSQGTVDLVLVSANATPTSLIVGRDVVFSVALGNEGTAPVTAVPVVLLSPGGGELARVSVTIPAGGSTTVALPWKATLLGEPFIVSVRADPFNTLAELDENNNEATVELSVTAAPETNLTVRSTSIAFDPDPLLDGQSAQISATVLNTTPVPAGPFAVKFYLGDPRTTGHLIGEQAIAGVGAGSSVVARVTWATVAGGGAIGIFVVVDADDSVAEYDETDNWAFRPFVVLGYPDLALSSAAVTLEPRFPRSGQLVRVRTQVRNVGGQPAPPSLLTVTEGEGDAAVVVASVPLLPLAVEESQAVEIDWTPAGAGERLLSLSADAGGVIVEADEGNNTARLLVIVQNADIYVTEVFFSPDGDGARDTTTLAYRAGSPVSIGVFDLAGRRLRSLADSAPSEGTVTWDGRADTGIIVPDGTYLFSVRQEGGVVVGTATTVVDTNREDLHGAAGTPMLLQRNLSCAIPDWLLGRLQGPVWTRAEDALLYIQPAPQEDSVFSAEPGLIRVGLDGSYEYMFRGEEYVGKSFASEVSPDGREVAIRDDSFQIEILDLTTGLRRPIPQQVDYLSWSPDAQLLVAQKTVITRLGDFVVELPTPDLDTFNESRWVWSPDGRFLANGTSVVNSDGSDYRTIGDLFDPDGGSETIIWSTEILTDGKIATSIAFGCSDGCAETRSFVVDPGNDEIKELTWLHTTRAEGGPLAVKWSSSGKDLLYVERPSDFAPSSSYVADQSGQSVRPIAESELYAPSPSGAGALFSKFLLPGICAGQNAQFALATLNNLSVSLEAIRLPGNRGVALKATAADRNLSFFQLDYADVAGNPDELLWRPIGPAYDSPVIDELLTIWVPPAPGTYAVRLGVEDRAGNLQARTQVISWDRSPVIANLTQSMRLISPNDDGIRDNVTFAYLVLEPTVVEVRINGPEARGGSVGPLVRAFALMHPSTGPASFVWDGRDELGVRVPDGVFTVSIADLPFSVKVDTTPPDIAWAYGPLQYEDGEISTIVSRHVVDANLKNWSLGASFTNPVFVPALAADGSPIFGPHGAPVAALGPDGRAADVRGLEQVDGVHTIVGAVVTASDRAGNTSSLTVAPVARGIFLLSVCEADPNLEEGKCRLERTYPNSKGSVKVPLRTIFRVVETSGEGHAPVRFEYRLRGTSTWVENGPRFSLGGRDVQPHTERFGDAGTQNFWPVDLEPMGLQLGAQYEGRFVREGPFDSLTSGIFEFSPCNPYVETMVSERTTGVLDPENTIYDVSIGGGVGEGVRQGRLRVSTDDGTVLADQPFDVRSGAEIRIPNGLSACSIAFAVELVGESGNTYSHLAPCQRLVKIVFPSACGSPGAGSLLAQVSGYCAAQPDQVRLLTRGLAGSDHIFEAGTPVGAPIPVERVFGQNYDYVWDVVGRPEGTELVRVGTRGSDGSLLNALSTDVVIDRTAPEVFVLDPAIDGGLVCPAVPLDDGSRAATFEFEADDSGARVEVCSASLTTLAGPLAGASRPIVPMCSRPDGASVQCGSPGTPQLLRVSTNTPASLTTSIEGLATGDYALAVNLADRAGNRTQVTRRFTMLGAAVGVEPPSPALFSPNADGLLDQTTIRIKVAQAATVSAFVDSVKDLLVNQSVAAGSTIDVTWDGRRADGSVVPDGEYSIVVRATDACNSVSTKRVTVEVDNTPPSVSIAAPADGALVVVSAIVRGHADDRNFSTYQLLSKPAFAGEFVALGPAVATRVPRDTAGQLGNWALSAPGVYLLRLSAVDRAQNRSETTISVNVGSPGALQRLGVAPDLFSPNDDGRRESATITYSLSAARLVTVQMLGSPLGNVVRTLQSSQDVPAGDYAMAWDGRDDNGGVVPDGEYSIRLGVTDPVAVAPDEVQEVRVLVDATPPTIQITLPVSQAVVARESEVRGSIEDPLLKEFSLNAISMQGGSSVELARGSTPVTQGLLASLSQLSDGDYSLFALAEDAAENRSIHEVPFVVDTTPPEVLFANPPPGAVLPIGPGLVSVAGTASDANLSQYSLSFGRGAEPSSFGSLKTDEAIVHDGELGAWDVSALPDDAYTLKLVAQDKAGLQAEVRRTVILDGTPPLAIISSPESGSRTNGGSAVVGTASDVNFESWVLEGAPGSTGPGSQWTELTRGTEPVIAGVLWDWAVVPPDGIHSFRLTVRDQAGHVSEAVTSVELDTQPPRPPVLVRVDIENRQPSAADLRVTWLPSPDTDIAGYVLHHDGDDDSIELGPTQFSYLDPAWTEGMHKYFLHAVDFAGNESDEVSIDKLLDLSPPAVAITAPAAGAFVSGEVQIRGIAFSAQDFKEYRLFIQPEGNPLARVLVRRSTLPVSNARLGTWLALGAGNYVVTLEAEDFSGNQAQTTSTVVVDNVPPAAVTMTSLEAVPDATSLTATWTPTSSTDARGYLLYRNGRLANTDALVLGDLSPFAIPDLTYRDGSGLPDGHHCYTVVVIDEAGNRSPPSNELCADLDNRPPHAVISSPEAGHAFDAPLLVAAVSPDTDIATVALEYRPTGTQAWLAIGPPDTMLPYEGTLAIIGLAEGDYDLRAVATDSGGQVDPSPDFITVRFTDVTPPSAPLSLTKHVDGDTIRLTWSAAPSALKYTVYRDGESITPLPVTDLTLDDPGRPIGQYAYAVTASDDHDNESPRSNEAIATVYAPALSSPPFPVLTDATSDLLVGDIHASGELEISRNDLPLSTVPAASGNMIVPAVPLEVGPNLFRVRALHADGDRSLWSAEAIFIRNEPPPPVLDLQATALGFAAALAWDPVSDLELAGYEVSRDGQSLSTAEPPASAEEIDRSPVLDDRFNRFSNHPTFAFDQNPGTVWIPPAEAFEPFLIIALPEPAMIRRVSLQFAAVETESFRLVPGAPADYRVDLRWEGRYLPALTVRGNQAESRDHDLPAPFLTDGIRVVLLGPARARPVGLSEVGLTAVRYVTPDLNSYQDSGLVDGRYGYSVAAVDRYGAVGSPGSAVVSVGDVQPPAAPLNLTATVVAGDVRLDWIGADPADTVHFVLGRDGEELAQTPSALTSHLDVAPLNGPHEYRVYAVDAVGNRSADSNVALVTIDEPVLAPPVLAGSGGPLGESVLSWAHDGAPYFDLLRSLGASGPFVHLVRSQETEYRDFSVPFGATAWYVVRAIDARGNPSLDSNVVSVTPARTEPPPPPVILEPTDSANPISIGVASSPVGGRTDRGTGVRVYVDGVLSAITQEESRFVPSAPPDLPAAALDVRLSASGSAALYTIETAGEWVLFWRDLVSGRTEMVPTGAYDQITSALLSPDGNRVAVFLYGPSTGFEGDLWVFDALTDGLSPVEEGPSAALNPSWSADSKRLAYGLRSSSFPYAITFEVKDLQSGAVDVAAGYVPYDFVYSVAVSLSPEGRRLVYGAPDQSGVPTLRIVDLDTRSNVVLGPGHEPTWNPSGTELAFSRPAPESDPDGQSSIVVRTIGTGAERVLSRAAGPRFDPTGQSLLFLSDYADLVVEDNSTGRRQTLGPFSFEYDWIGDDQLAFRDYFTDRLILIRREHGYFTANAVALHVGENIVTARATEPTSGLESEDSLPISITLEPDGLPDLMIDPAGRIVYPAVPRTDQASAASALVKNEGAVSAADVLVSLEVRAPSGELLTQQRLAIPFIVSGGSVRVVLPFTAQAEGRYFFTATVDPDHTIVESEEDNNEQASEIDVVSAASPLTLSVTPGSPRYEENGRALVSVQLANGGPAASGILTTRIESASDGSPATVLDSRPVSLGFGTRLTLPLTWEVAHAYAGAYRARSTLVDALGSILADAAAPIEVLPSTSALARLVAERYSTGLGSSVPFTATVENASRNAPLIGAQARFTITSTAGLVALQAEVPLPTMLPGALWSQGLVWSPAMPAGGFEARFEVIHQATTLSSSNTQVVIFPVGPALGGRITLAADHVLELQGALADATLTNAGGEPRSAVDARVEVRTAATGEIVESIPFTVDLPASGSLVRPTALAGRPAGRYLVTLVDAATGLVVDRASLRVHAVIAPPSLHGPADGSRVATSHPELSVNNAAVSDGAPLTYEFQIFADSSLTVALPGGRDIAEWTAQTPWRVPTRLVEDHTYYWRARASDGFSTSAWTSVASFMVDEINDSPFAPIPETPEPGARVATRQPSMVVRNAIDPEGDALAYEFQLATDPNALTVIATAASVAETPVLTAWLSPITLTEDATYYWRARAFDGTSYSPWSEIASFIVDSRNESPGSPTILAPVSGSTVASLSPLLVAGPASDPENDPLLYGFEIDTSPAFDSPALQAASDLAPGTGTVTWTPPVGLQDDTTYFWRVVAADATTQGPWAQASFRVNLANDPPNAPVPLAPSDGEIVSTNLPTLLVRNATDPDGDTLTYEFMVADESHAVVAAVTDVPSGLIDTTVVVPVALAENGAFTWQARARDAETFGPWSEPSSFRVNQVQDPPTAPTAFSPLGGIQIDSLRPTLVLNNAISPDGLPLTYTIELFREESGVSTLVTAASGVVEAQPRTSWPVDQDLADGSYSWRARASDGVLDGPWSQSALFSVLVDAPPATPTGLVAVGGDGQITIAWNRNPEPDVVGYRVYRSSSTGGPYAVIATVVDPGLVDAPLPNGVTQYYVATAFDSRFESLRSSQASATPMAASLLAAQIIASPDRVAVECLVGGTGHSGQERDDYESEMGKAKKHDDDDDDHDDDDDDDEGNGCVTWIKFGIELPAGVPPTTIDRASVRVAGSVPVEPSYDRIVDSDHDGIPEREFRVRFSALAPFLQVGANVLSVSGTSSGTPFLGGATITVLPFAVEMKFVPRTLNKKSKGQEVQTELTFEEGVSAADVLFSSVRLNGVVPAERVVSSRDEKITYKFDRAAVANLLPVGSSVEVSVSGTIRGLPFTARDIIRVIQ